MSRTGQCVQVENTEVYQGWGEVNRAMANKEQGVFSGR
jgi:hypothetical protein